MNLEQEKQLAVLIAIRELGGAATKSRTLDLIDARNWLLLDNHDRETMDLRNEERWRNDLAFTRHHLVQSGRLDGSTRNRWALTPSGGEYLQTLLRIAKSSSFQKLSPSFQRFLSQLG